MDYRRYGIDAIRETAGIKTAAARRLGCNVSTIDRYIERYPTVAAGLHRGAGGDR
ncbi:MAG: helix-turn-helix domain-containing protein [Thermomicrobiales bacterium]